MICVRTAERRGASEAVGRIHADRGAAEFQAMLLALKIIARDLSGRGLWSVKGCTGFTELSAYGMMAKCGPETVKKASMPSFPLGVAGVYCLFVRHMIKGRRRKPSECGFGALPRHFGLGITTLGQWAAADGKRGL
jgi:hypothetical protein